MYTSFLPNQTSVIDTIQKLEVCVHDIKKWMSSNSLKLNQEKSEVLFIGSKTLLDKVSLPSIKIDNVVITPSKSCRNLGVQFDSTMSMSVQISAVCKSVRYQLRNLGIIRQYLTRSATEKIVHALISSRLDFGNALLFQLPHSQLSLLQKLQNSAARIVTLTRRTTHITPVLSSLHWLPVESRIVFKLLLLVFHCMHGSAPEYNINLLMPYNPPRRLRSSDSKLLTVPKTKKLWGDRSFAHAGPYLWNQLPQDIRYISSVNCFKNALKTYLFKSAFL